MFALHTAPISLPKAPRPANGAESTRASPHPRGARLRVDRHCGQRHQTASTSTPRRCEHLPAIPPSSCRLRARLIARSRARAARLIWREATSASGCAHLSPFPCSRFDPDLHPLASVGGRVDVFDARLRRGHASLHASFARLPRSGVQPNYGACIATRAKSNPDYHLGRERPGQRPALTRPSTSEIGAPICPDPAAVDDEAARRPPRGGRIFSPTVSTLRQNTAPHGRW
ncbi:hypothetical protein M433DRAFT_308640 [Acidomyces richmondensis BFW]|nr:MAG: hypothetical protein FE78DRAFT_77034 [Acidomyces sp. 'richmondensis']KYG44341.1 hypothetical protein M433DRAFT_308640 [Acidomyces richmondensis BFW]